jgi:hypothetical protein
VDLSQLIALLGIDVPVLLHTEEAGTHTLHLYGGRMVVAGGTVAGAAGAAKAAVPGTVDFAIVKGLGTTANANLHRAGIHTWADVDAAETRTLLRYLTAPQLVRLREWCALDFCSLADSKETL